MKSLKFLICMSLCMIMLMGMVGVSYAYSGGSSLVYNVYVDDQQVGVVKFAARALSIYDNVEKDLRASHDEEIFINSNIYFKEIKSGSKNVTNEKVLAKAIELAMDVKVNAYAIDIAGKKVCYVQKDEDAQKVIDDIMAPYIKTIEENEKSQLEESTIKEDVSFDGELISREEIISTEEAVQIILDGAEAIKEYEVKEGDNIWIIAEAHNLPVSVLEEANPEMKDAIIQPGDKVKIGKVEKLLTVVTKEKMEYTEKIDFEKEVKEDNTLEKGQTKILQEGQKGEKDVIALITREDGQEISRDILEETIKKEAVKQVEAIGTKEKPKATTATQPAKTTQKSSSTPSSPAPEASRGSGKGQDVANYAMKFLGYSYRANARGPNSFDCSGFTHYVYKQFGINISSGSVAQRSVGTAVAKSDLRPGDLVCFKNGNHVGLYIGGGNFIHASTYKTGVKISNLKDGKYPSRYVTGRRLIN